MSLQWVTVEGDREPLLVVNLRNHDSSPIDWTGAVFTFEIKKKDAALIIRDTSTGLSVLSTNGTTARVQYAWRDDDGLEAGKSIEARFVATMASGKRMSFPKGETIKIVVKARLA